MKKNLGDTTYWNKLPQLSKRKTYTNMQNRCQAAVIGLRIIRPSCRGVWLCFSQGSFGSPNSKPPVTWDPMILRVVGILASFLVTNHSDWFLVPCTYSAPKQYQILYNHYPRHSMRCLFTYIYPRNYAVLVVNQPAHWVCGTILL